MGRKINFPVESVWILGSTSEIARCLCIELAKKGCQRFHLIARNISLNNSFKNFLSKKYNVIVTTQFIDLSEEKPSEEFKAIKIDDFDLYFIAAGTMGSNELARNDFIEAQNILNINFFSLIKWITKIVTKERIRLNSRLWIMSSVAGDIGRPSNYHYGSAKAGLTKFCEGIMHSCQDKPFKVRVIKAGYIATKMTIDKAPKVLCAAPEKLAKKLLLKTNKRGIEYFPKWWFLVMFFIKLMPSRVIKKL